MPMANNSESTLKILFITRWYPNKYDPQFGVFVQKHARAASRHCQVSVLCVLPDPVLRNNFVLEEEQSDGVHEFILYFRPFNSGIRFVDKAFNLLYYFLYSHLALRVIERKRGIHDITHAVVLGRAAWTAW